MKIVQLMKQCLSTVLSVSLLLAVSSCADTDYTFTQTEDGNLVSISGTEYEYLGIEWDLCYLGDLIFQGSVKGEEKTFRHMDTTYQTGLFSIKNDETNNILIRRPPYSEWYSVYRKTSLPSFDFSVDNCIRLELILGPGYEESDGIHTVCGDGITGKAEIAEFLSDVRSQMDPREAGLYGLDKTADGATEYCYLYAVIYGFFEDEPNVAVPMYITSYYDLAYSVYIEGKDYVLPNTWVQRLQDAGGGIVQ